MHMFIFILVVVASMMVGGSHAQFQGSSNYAHLRGVQSSKCVTVRGASLANEAVVEIWDCIPDANNELWLLSGGSTFTNGNYYMLKAKQSGKCLTVQGMSAVNEGGVIQWDCVEGGQSNQLWKFEQDSDGFYTIIGKGSNKCLTVHGAGVVNGSYLVIYDCVGATNQKWIAEP